MIKVGLISLGCAKNQVDSELMLSKLKNNNINILDEYCDADVVIINTCGFIEQAKKEAIENILEVVALKNEGRVKGIVVTGCLSERYKDEIANEIPEVDCFLGTGSYEHILSAVQNAYKNNRLSLFAPTSDYSFEGDRLLISPVYSAYLKISEGCSNCCSYCAIPGIRGKLRSRKIESIVIEAEHLASIGTKELVIIAQDTTSYGLDIYQKQMLPDLLLKLSQIENIKWIRVMYMYPDKITDELLTVMSESDKILNYIEMPIQHTSTSILQRMNRSYSNEELKSIIEKIRANLQDVVIRTTVMVGFPGETDEDFENLCSFIEWAKFDRLGVFTFSSEEGTKAAEYTDTIDQSQKEKRSDIIMDIAARIGELTAKTHINRTLDILVEGYDKYIKHYYGRSYMDAPEIDGKVFFTSNKKLKEGDFVKVKIIEKQEYDLWGIVE